MHPETKKINTKNMPYLTLTENLKLQLQHQALTAIIGGKWHQHYVFTMTFL